MGLIKKTEVIVKVKNLLDDNVVNYIVASSKILKYNLEVLEKYHSDYKLFKKSNHSNLPHNFACSIYSRLKKYWLNIFLPCKLQRFYVDLFKKIFMYIFITI